MTSPANTTLNTSLQYWLLCYDIREARRLQKLYQYVRRHAFPIQYSIWLLESSERQLQSHLASIQSIIATTEDDVRLYHLTKHCRCWQLGKHHADQGFDWIESHAHELMNSSHLQRSTPSIAAEWQ